MVGSGTALADDPSLDLRHGVLGPLPVRVVVDRRLRVTADLRLADTTEQATVVLCTPGSHGSAAAGALVAAGVELVPVAAPEDTWLRVALGRLHERGHCEVLVEGGATLAGALLRAGLVDCLELMLAPKLLGAGAGLWRDLGIDTLADALHLHIDQVQRLGPDIHISATPGDSGD
jgi:diaminohydroxyphosphoribosylaminopyrimidine deaminase/5-amino-6-(5-phosphoribosylamino)uracil reductase